MIDFTQEFKTYSNSDLLKITNNPDDYQPLAVEAAQAILATRQVSGQDFEIAAKDLFVLRQENEARRQKKQQLENKVKNIGTSFLSVVNPVQTEPSSADRTINIVSIVFGVFSLFILYSGFGMLRFIFSGNQASLDLGTDLYLLHFIILPIATISFFERKKMGWVLLSVFLTYSVIDTVGRFILTLKTHLSVSALANLFPQYSPIMFIWPFLFFGGALWVICKPRIIEIFSINRNALLKSIGITVILTLIMIYISFI